MAPTGIRQVNCACKKVPRGKIDDFAGVVERGLHISDVNVARGGEREQIVLASSRRARRRRSPCGRARRSGERQHALTAAKNLTRGGRSIGREKTSAAR